MVLREFMSAFLILTLFELAFTGTLFEWLIQWSATNCHTQNEQLLMEQREGPLRECLR